MRAAHPCSTLSHRRTCLAESADGLTWTKPSLGIYARNGSTANNILVEDSGNSVFWDPSATSSEDIRPAPWDPRSLEVAQATILVPLVRVRMG